VRVQRPPQSCTPSMRSTKLAIRGRLLETLSCSGVLHGNRCAPHSIARITLPVCEVACLVVALPRRCRSHMPVRYDCLERGTLDARSLSVPENSRGSRLDSLWRRALPRQCCMLVQCGWRVFHDPLSVAVMSCAPSGFCPIDSAASTTLSV
ncbi:hypothetical protein JI435_013210, partial [Parastagonospora nodorum SN15]